jgi:hypothetical protein
MNTRPAVYLICALIVAGGCAASGTTSMKKLPAYNVIRLFNDSDDEISNVELSAGGTISSLDKLPAQHSPTADRGVSPDPQTAKVSWKTYDGRNMQREVAIARDMPPGFHGVIVLRLGADGDVNVEFVPYSDLR